MRTVRYGDKGNDVAACQATLKLGRFGTTSEGEIRVDGVFGERTKMAVLEFQRYYKQTGLYTGAVDGIFGPKCWHICGY